MEAKHFEALSRQVGAAGSRRAALLAVAGAILAPVLGLGREEADAGIPIVHCKPPGKFCDSDKKCCNGACRNGVCGCSKKGRPCWAPLEGALCCSRRCRKGKCA